MWDAVGNAPLLQTGTTAPTALSEQDAPVLLLVTVTALWPPERTQTRKSPTGPARADSKMSSFRVADSKSSMYFPEKTLT